MMVKYHTFQTRDHGSNPFANNFFQIFRGDICPPKFYVAPPLFMTLRSMNIILYKSVSHNNSKKTFYEYDEKLNIH